MKQHNLSLFTAFALAIAGIVPAWAVDDGHVYEFRPITDVNIASDAFGAAQEIKFKMRLISPNPQETLPANRHQWEIYYKANPGASASEQMLAWITTPLQVGVMVSGQIRGCDITFPAPATTAAGDVIPGRCFNDIICTYTTRFGDLALPLKLATKSDGSYVFVNDNLWGIRDAEAFAADGTIVEPNLFRCEHPQAQVPEMPRNGSYDLAWDFAGTGDASKAYYIKTLGFDDKSVTDAKGTWWRTVNEGRTTYKPDVPAIAAGLQAAGVTLYVWSEDDSKVTVKFTDNEALLAAAGVSKMTFPDRTDTPREFWVRKIVLDGSAAEYPFDLKGVAQSDAGTTLVLRAQPGYAFQRTVSPAVLLEDFLTVQVRCSEPLPPTVTAKVNGLASDTVTVRARGEVATRVATLTVELSDAYPAGDVTVKVEPKLAVDGVPGESALGYFGLCEADKAGSLAYLEKTTEVTVEKDGALSKTLYVYAWGADAKTYGSNKSVAFVPEVEDPTAAAFFTGGSEKALLLVKPIKPAVLEPVADQLIQANCSVPYGLTIRLSDTYNDMNSDEGYEVYVKKDISADLEFTKLEGKYKPDADGVLYSIPAAGESPQLPQVTWENTSTEKAALYVKSPMSGEKSEERQISLYVKPARQIGITTTDGHPGNQYIEGDDVNVEIELLNAKNDTGDTIYAFLVPQGEATNAVNAVWLAGHGMSGRPIAKNNSTVQGLFTLLDGTMESKQGAMYDFKIELRTKQYYDDPDGKAVPGFESRTLTLYSQNVVPTVKYVEMTNTTDRVKAEGERFALPVARNVEVGFEVKVNEPGTYDKTTTEAGKMFKTRWVVREKGKTPKPVILEGNPDKQTFFYKFTKEGIATVELYLQDKDMGDWADEPFTFEVEVISNPMITITSTTGVTKFSETDSMEAGGEAALNVNLSLNPVDAEPLRVELTIKPPSASAADNPGTFELQESSSCTKTGANTYVVTFDGSTQETINLKTLDGTPLSRSTGFTIESKVLNDDIPYPDVPGETPASYYKGIPANFKVENAAPSVLPGDIYPQPESTNKCAIGAADAITWNFTDVEPDFSNNSTKGITVTIKGGKETFTTNVTTAAAAAGSYAPVFEDSGLNIVTLTIKDKDGGSVSFLFYYEVAVSKKVILNPHGPTGGKGAANGKRYRTASGLGEGHVYGGDAKNLSSVSGFESTYNCQMSKQWTVWGFGYKVDAPEDNGLLNGGKDIPLTPGGSQAEKGQAAGSYYRYPASDYRDVHGLPSDSFLYTWLCVTRGEDTAGFTDEILNGAVSPEYAAITSDSGTPVGLPTEKLDDETYDDTILEAVFSREYLATDNMGDINYDGIPDIYVDKYGFGIVDPLTKQVAGDDLTGLAGFNDDEDFLPLDATAFAGSMIHDIKEKWTRKFTADVEIRGFGEALNDAPVQIGLVGVKPDLVYLNPDPLAADYCPSSTLSKVEYMAWCEYAAANLPEGAVSNAAYFAKWSPERPTDPTKADTDEDGFDDGFEYCYWYLAHVGWIDAFGVHHRLSGRAYDPRNPGEGRFIRPEEIEQICDPLIKYIGQDADSRDTDNDGLPDLLEFEIGTNPFDFDTDKDGLPDGWELMIAGLDPLMASSSADALLDTERNYDGDAMAISSFELEKQQNPVPFDIEHAKRFTFAVLAPNGDTDGVQWYAMTKMPEFACTTQETATAWSFTAFGTNIVSYAEPKLTADGRLAQTLEKGFEDTGAYIAGEVTSVTNISEDETVTNVLNLAVRGFPIRIEAGTPVSDVKEGANPVVMAISAEVKEKEANACWIYGKGTVTNAFGQVAKTANDYGCLALGRYQGVPEGAVLCALPEDTRDVAFLHYLCYQEFGFDPRTAWKAKDPLATRWSKAIDGDSVEGITQMRRGGYTGKPTRTRDYTAYDEFLVYSFFVNNGCDMAGVTYVVDESAPEWAKIWGAFTTNPQGPNEPELISGDHYYGRNSDQGADTDGDGVPDGWELYTMAGPKTSKGEYVFANPYTGFFTGLNDQNKMPKSFFSPFVASADTTDTSNQIYLGGQANDDLMNQYEEFEGTDTMAYYADYSSTVVHKGEWKWFNKFFPTDPWNRDTDGDGISDKDEGATEFSNPNGLKCCFIYGTPADDGKLWSIPGGGLNPCSVDTDGDGLPDPWERQFAGSLTSIFTEEKAPVGPDGKAFIDFAKDADGNPIGNALQGLTDGMDGTVKDATSYPFTNKDNSDGTSWVRIWKIDGFQQVVNRDYDHDGLENWQEYLTGMMRCWRYDDPFSPWESVPEEWYGMRDPTTGLFSWAPKYDKFGIAEGDDDAFWYMTLVDRSSPYYNPHLIVGQNQGAQYFTRVTNVWDTAYCDTTLRGSCSYYWFFDRVGGEKIADVWTGNMMNPGPLFNLVGAFGGRAAPTKYACCSPINADSDGDGMDDYYELFHGLNPLLGQSGQPLSAQGPADLVYDAWYLEGAGALEAWGAPDSPTQNYWQANPRRAARGSGFDFEVFPWLNGLQEADPDGDDIRNGEEAIMARLATKAWHHTDPTPLWMTDTTFSNSLVRQYFRLPAGPDNPDVGGAVVLPESGTFKHGEDVYHFRDFDGFFDNSRSGTVDTKGMPPYWFERFKPDFWSVYAMGEPNWLFSFEENEGYDTDHDGLSDNDELAGKLRRGGTDPLDVDSPRRRQAMYFQGKERPSALQSMPFVIEKHPYGSTIYPTDLAFLQYTVECWVMPESLDDSTVIERAVYVGESNPGDMEFMRCNFQLGIHAGKWYTKFDPNGTLAGNQVEIHGSDAELGKWTHLAATYDGATLRLYVDNTEASRPSGLQPSYGTSVIATQKDQTYWLDREYPLCAILVGASFRTVGDGITDGNALDVTQGLGWDRYKGFFKGYVDEIRVWDGARKAVDIEKDLNVRYDAARAAANRQAFYDQWLKGEYRYAVDGKGSDYDVVPELRFHWAFDSVFGAQNEAAVVKCPNGFGLGGFKAPLSRPEGYAIPWFETILAGYAGTVYDYPAWVTWIPNTVAHLPRFDGSTLDSIFWSADFAGDESGTFAFANSAEPYSRWTQYLRNGITVDSQFWTTGSRHNLVNQQSYTENDLDKAFDFAGRNRNLTGDDLIPLGGAFVKYVPNDPGLWDGQGASSTWELTGDDANGNGLPDWWELYADQNYREGVDPSVEMTWSEPMLKYGDIWVTPGEAYLRDIAKGGYLGEDGKAHMNSDEYRQNADVDRNGLPDWWAELYGLGGESGLDDHDNDGLPNYVEYLLSEVFAFKGIVFDPTVPCSVDPYTPDYFFRVGELYVGEIFTDHDRMYDTWEDLYPVTYLTRLVYDAWGDEDSDGWSNVSEMHAGSDPTRTRSTGLEDQVLADYPVPMIHARVKIPDDLAGSIPIVVQAFSGTTVGKADATWSTSASGDAFAKEKFVGTNPGGVKRYYLSPGSVSPGKVAILFNDQNAVTHTETIVNGVRQPDKNVITGSGWSEIINDKMRPNDSSRGDLIDAYNEIYGWIDYVTGELEIDFSKARSYGFILGTDSKADSAGGVTTTSSHLFLDLTQAYVKFTWSAKLVKQGALSDLYLTDADDGYVREGVNAFVAWADKNGNGAWDVGEPYGVSRGVDVSWSSTTTEIELTEVSPIMPRIQLSSGEKDKENGGKSGGSGGESAESAEKSDRGQTVTEVLQGVRDYIDVTYGNQNPQIYSNMLKQVAWIEGNLIEPAALEASSFKEQRVRIVRWLVNGVPTYRGSFDSEVVFDKKIKTDVKASLTEADILLADEKAFDLDWANLRADVASDRTVIAACGNVTNVSYLVVVGDGQIGWITSPQTNYAVKALNTVVTRRFGRNHVVPELVSPGAGGAEIVLTASPTFKWTMDCPEEEGYTAFRIQVSGDDGLVFDSGVQDAPARVNGAYTWAAPLYVGDKTQEGKVFANKTNYTWKVTMYNAKFTEDAYSETGAFRMDMRVDGYAFGQANVAVKYFGPKKSYIGGKYVEKADIRVRAYTSPDFSGRPVAAGYVADPDDADNGVSVTGRLVTANCHVLGLPKGSYYLQAFIDSNGNGVCDRWETSGYLCKRDGKVANYLDPVSIVFDEMLGEGDTAVIYLEDADTDADGLPDSWEYAEFGSLTEKGIELVSETKAGEFLVNTDLSGALELQENANVPTAGLAGQIRNTIMRLSSPAGVSAATGIDPADIEVTDGGLVVKSEVDPETLTIVGFAVDAAQNRVLLKVGAETTADINPTVANFLNITVKKGAEVTVKVERAESPNGPWTELKGVDGTVTVDRAGADIEVKLNGELPAQGYFRAKVEE